MDNSQNNYLEINKRAWNQRTPIHVDSAFYNVDAFLAGASSLNDIELDAVGKVSGKSLLHLQCHFGQDTLSWARYGAEVTGVDLSDTAIAQARKLAEQLGLQARFICEDIYRFAEVNTQQYDIVFTSYGALCWLPDLTPWAAMVKQALKPGGYVHVVEFHPMVDLMQGYAYFHSSEADIESSGTYTENCDGEQMPMAVWAHTMSDVISALLSVGIRIEQVSEFPYSPYNCFDGLSVRADGGYEYLYRGNPIPLVYALKGGRP